MCSLQISIVNDVKMLLLDTLALVSCYSIQRPWSTDQTNISGSHKLDWKLLLTYRDSLVVQTVKSLPAVWETWVQSLGREDPLKKEMATHSTTLAWKIPWTEESGRLQSMGLQRVEYN